MRDVHQTELMIEPNQNPHGSEGLSRHREKNNSRWQSKPILCSGEGLTVGCCGAPEPERPSTRTREAGVAKCGVLEDFRQTAPPGYMTNGLKKIVENGRETKPMMRSYSHQGSVPVGLMAQ